MNSEYIKNLVKSALQEDIGNGDITSNLTISARQNANFNIIAKEDLIFCGKSFILESFIQINFNIKINFNYDDGDIIKKSQIICYGTGSAKDILQAERVALNFAQYLSGISSNTKKYVDLVKPYGVKILDTRKTLPLYRKAAKYAVTKGGGINHRFALDDQILIKDNHIIAAGSINNALTKCFNTDLKVEIECETLDQVKEVLKNPPDIIMLDNMHIENIKKAVRLIAKKSKIEVSGNVSLENIIALAQTGIDYISIGRLTHSVMAVDISLDLQL